MKATCRRFTYLFGCGILLLTVHQAGATTTTSTGTFATDNTLYQYSLNLTQESLLTAFTNSYGGGVNLDGSTTKAGGFITDLTLFSVATGEVVAFDGASGACHAGQHADPKTGMCDDAYLSADLQPGKYLLDLTEFPNVATGGIHDGFLFQGSPNATGDICGISGGQFLQTDMASCMQRSDAFSLNVATSPEPASLGLAASALVALGLIRRRKSNPSIT